MQGKRKKVAVNMFSQGVSLSTSIYGGFHSWGVLGGLLAPSMDCVGKAFATHENPMGKKTHSWNFVG